VKKWLIGLLVLSLLAGFVVAGCEEPVEEPVDDPDEPVEEVHPFEDKRVRQALNYAVDKEAIIETIFQGVGSPSSAPIVPAIFGYTEVGPYEYNPEKAMELLEEAGFGDGFEIELYHPTGRYPQDDTVAEAVQAMLAEVGVTANLTTYDWGTYLETVLVPPEMAEHDAYMLGWGTVTLDADYGTYALFHSTQWPTAEVWYNNASYYANEEVDELLAEARVTPDRDVREGLYEEAIELIWEDAPWLFLHNEGQVNAVRSNVEGLIHHPLENILAWDAKIVDEDEQDLIIAIGAEAESLDPLKMTSAPAATVAEHMVETLVYLAADGSLEPALATSWEPDEDGASWILELREGVTFHDGEPFNADAVKYNLDRFLAKGDFEGQDEAAYAFLLEEVQEVEVVDEYTIKLHLEREFAPIISHLSHSFIGMHSPAALEELEEDEVVEAPVGTGAFKYVSWDRGEEIVMERNEDYWGDVTELDTVTFKFVPEGGSRVVMVETGEAHAIMAVPPTEIERLEGEEDIDVVFEDSVRVIYIGFNLQPQ